MVGHLKVKQYQGPDGALETRQVSFYKIFLNVKINTRDV